MNSKPFSRGDLVVLKEDAISPAHSRHKDAPASAVLMVTSCGEKKFDAVLLHDWEVIFPARGKMFSRLKVENYKRRSLGTEYRRNGAEFALVCQAR